MINDTAIKDYIIISNQFIDEFDIDSIVKNLHHVALSNDMNIESYTDCDSFPVADFIEAFVQALSNSNLRAGHSCA